MISSGGKMVEQLKFGVFLSSLVYSFVGVLVFWLSFLIIDRLTPYHLWKEIIEEKNTALASVVGGIAIGICIIVAAAIHG
jgi:putative membrane protein